MAQPTARPQKSHAGRLASNRRLSEATSPRACRRPHRRRRRGPAATAIHSEQPRDGFAFAAAGGGGGGGAARRVPEGGAWRCGGGGGAGRGCRGGGGGATRRRPEATPPRQKLRRRRPPAAATARATRPPAAGARLRPAAPASSSSDGGTGDAAGGRRARGRGCASRGAAPLDRREGRLEVRDALVRRDLGLARRESHEPRRHGAQRVVGGLGPEERRRRVLGVGELHGAVLGDERAPDAALSFRTAGPLEQRRLPEALGLGPRQRDDDDGPRRRRRERQEQRREERPSRGRAARRDGKASISDAVDAAAVDRDLCVLRVVSARWRMIATRGNRSAHAPSENAQPPRHRRARPKMISARTALRPSRRCACDEGAAAPRARRERRARREARLREEARGPLAPDTVWNQTPGARHRRDAFHTARTISKRRRRRRARTRGAREVRLDPRRRAAVTRTTASRRAAARRGSGGGAEEACAPLVAAETAPLSR